MKDFPQGASRVPTDAQRRNAKLKLNGKNPRPKTPKWSHQHDLEGNIGKIVEGVFKEADAVFGGKLIAADSFAIKIESVNDGRQRIIFKHDISTIEFRAE